MGQYFRGLLFALVLVGGAVGVAWRVGDGLSPEHEAVASGVVAAPPAQVWGLMTDMVPQYNWRKGLHWMQNGVLDQGRPCWNEDRKPHIIHFCVVEEVVERRRVVQMQNRKAPYSVLTVYELEPIADGTKMTITERSTISRPLWRFWGKYVLRENTEARQYLRDLQTEVTRPR